MKRLIRAGAFACLLITLLAGMLAAGPLDRQSTGSRTNEASQGMIRIPGVVGQDQATAMTALQQAGLNVAVYEAKKMPKGMAGAAGMEGKVVSQTPAPGGMGLYGTTVSIYIWKPNESVGNTGDSTGSTGWDSSSYDSSTSQQSVYTDQSTQSSGYTQPSYTETSAGSSQQFQVQQYYYPSGTDTTGQESETTADSNQQGFDQNATLQDASPQLYQQQIQQQ